MPSFPVPEAPLVDEEAGRRPSGDGWFVLNVGDALAYRRPDGAATIMLEHLPEPFPDVGVNVRLLPPGVPACLYHAEEAQEGFLVLAGECLLVVEEQERRMRRWDYFHAPAGTRHVLVGAGEGPCAILMLGGRSGGEEPAVIYPVSAIAAAHGASAEMETTDPAEAYAGWDRGGPAKVDWPC